MGSILQHIQSLTSYAERSGARLVRSSLPDAVHGRVTHDVIMLRTDLNPEEELSTLVHELAHWLAHRGSKALGHCTVFEYEAEAVEALVKARLGLSCWPPTEEDPTDDLLSDSVSRVVWATGRICDALGLEADVGASKP